MNGVSASQLRRAPEALLRHSLGHVHLATPLADGADRRPAVDKGAHAIVIGRITPGKGQHLAARLAHECGFDLVLAGPIGPHRQPADLAAAGNAAAANSDVCYWKDEVRPLVDGTRVRWVGTLGLRSGILWWRPGGSPCFRCSGTSPAEPRWSRRWRWGRRRLGYPVAACPSWWSTGAPGGWPGQRTLSRTWCGRPARFDPRECREQAVRRFAPAVMAARYAALYEEVISGDGKVVDDQLSPLAVAPGRSSGA